MVFLSEVQIRNDAFQWAKETSRTNVKRPAVVALYDNSETNCVYVGMFEDSAFAVAALAKKHGKEVVASIKVEPFPPEVFEQDFGIKMMEGLVKMWLTELKDYEGQSPVGNSEAGWDEYDKEISPFLIGTLSDREKWESIEIDARPDEEKTDEEILDERKEKLFKALNEAMKNGEEEKANGLMKKLNALGQEGIETGIEVQGIDGF